jgi:ribonuclease HI
MSLLHTYSDGGARGNPGPAAIGYVLAEPSGKIIAEGAECIGEMTNNKAEYRAMLKALELAKAHGAKQVLSHADSELLVFQLQGSYRIKDAGLKELAEKVKSAARSFEAVSWKQIPREHPMIRRADKLLNQALNRAKATAPLKRVQEEPTQGEFL